MKLNFRQGIVKATIVDGSPNFLVLNGIDGVTLDVKEDYVTVTIAHKDKNYLIDERKNVAIAWGPIAWNPVWGTAQKNQSYYLYWDINAASGSVTRGFTPHAPVASTNSPIPVLDLNWYDLTEKITKVWDGQFWVEKIRVFAAQIRKTDIIYFPLGTQVGIDEDCEAGYILYGMDARGVKATDNITFVTTATPLYTEHGTFSAPIRIELATPTAVAAQLIPAFFCVTSLRNDSIGLASLTGGLRPFGIVDRNVEIGKAADVIISGIVFNDQWNFNPLFAQELYCDINGEVRQGPVNDHSLDNIRVGIALGPKTAYINIDFYGSLKAIGSGVQGPIGPTGPAGGGSAPEVLVISYNSNNNVDLDLYNATTFIDFSYSVNIPSSFGAIIPGIYPDFISSLLLNPGTYEVIHTAGIFSFDMYSQPRPVPSMLYGTSLDGSMSIVTELERSSHIVNNSDYYGTSVQWTDSMIIQSIDEGQNQITKIQPGIVIQCRNGSGVGASMSGCITIRKLNDNPYMSA